MRCMDNFALSTKLWGASTLFITALKSMSLRLAFAHATRLVSERMVPGIKDIKQSELADCST